MSSKSLFTLGGFALILSAITGPLGPAFHPPEHSVAYISTWNWTVAHMLDYITYVLRVFGMIALYARISHRLGILGLAAIVLMTLLQAESMTHMMEEINIIPTLAALPGAQNVFNLRAYGNLNSALYLAGALAYIVFGVLVMREWRAARWAGFVFIVGIIASLVGIGVAGILKNTIPVIISFTVFSFAYGWFGVLLTRGEETAPQRAELATARA